MQEKSVAQEIGGCDVIESPAVETGPPEGWEVPGVTWIEDPELVATIYPETPWLIEGELPVGFTLVLGAPKVGKTALVLPLAHRLVRKGLRVLYVMLDDSLRRMRGRTIMANPKRDRLSGLWYVSGWNPRNPIDAFHQMRIWLKAAAAAGKAFGAVVVDTYGRLIGRRPPGDVFGFDYDMGQQFKNICEECDTSMIVTHHTRKGTGQEEDWLDAVSGSAGMTASTDAIWYITRTRGTREGLLRGTGNDVQDFEKPVILGSDMVWRFNDKVTPAQARHSGVPRAVLDLLLREGGMTAPAMCKAIGANDNTMHSALQRLAAEGLLELLRVGRDQVWSLTAVEDNRIPSENDASRDASQDPGPPPAPGVLPAEPPQVAPLWSEPVDVEGPPAPAGVPCDDAVVPVTAGTSRATSKLVEVLTNSRLHPLFKLEQTVKDAIDYDWMCLGGAGNQWNLWPARDPGGLVFRFDRKAAYFASHPWLVPNVLTKRGPMDWEQVKGEHLAGVFQIQTTPWQHRNLPSPYGQERPRKREMVTRATLNRMATLVRMGLMEMPTILSGWVGRGSENLLNDWLDWCLAQRRTAYSDVEMAAARKADQNLALGSLRIVKEGKRPGVVDRPDWQYAIISHHYAMMNHYAVKSLLAGEPLVAQGNTDELVYAMPAGTDPGWVPETLKPLMVRRQFALKAVESSAGWFEASGRGNR